MLEIGICGDCLFFKATYSEHGRCRRLPPTSRTLNNAPFPEVNIGQWCGEFLSRDRGVTPDDTIEKQIDSERTKSLAKLALIEFNSGSDLYNK